MYRALTSFTTKDYDVKLHEKLQDDFTSQNEIDEFLEIGYIEEYDGSIDITENGTYNVKDYETADVNVSGGSVNLQSKDITITENGTQTITADTGYDGLDEVEIDVNVSGGSGEIISIGAGDGHQSYSKSGWAYMLDYINKHNTLDVEGTSCQDMFYSFNRASIPKLRDTSNVTNMSYMFYKVTNVTNYNLQNYDTSNVTNMSFMFASPQNVTPKLLDLSHFNFDSATNTSYMFSGRTATAILDISGFDSTLPVGGRYAEGMFQNIGRDCLQSDGAYADGIPYIYVKDATAQNWVLTANNGHPSTWSTNNVVIKS